MALELRSMFKNEAFAALEVLSQIREHGLLDSLSDVLHSPCNLSYEVILVNDYSGIGKQVSGDLGEIAAHIAYKELDLEPFIPWNGEKVTEQSVFIPVGKDIKNFMSLTIDEKTLVLAGIGIAFEFINAKDFGHFAGFRIFDEVEDS